MTSVLVEIHPGFGVKKSSKTFILLEKLLKKIFNFLLTTGWRQRGELLHEFEISDFFQEI